MVPVAEYSEYLKSEHWQVVRAQALEYAEHRCQLCYSPNQLNVHHRTYERKGHERVSDLTVLCRGCHERFHGRRGAPNDVVRMIPVNATPERARRQVSVNHAVATLEAGRIYSTAEIAAVAGLTKVATGSRLAALVRSGHIVKIAQGRWMVEVAK